MKNDRPWVTMNVAMTADGKIDTVARQGAAISSPDDWERVDRLRAASDAVMVGGRTLLGEDPRLTVKSAALREWRRSRGLDENPAKVGIVSEATLAPSSRFLTHGPARILVFTTGRTDPAQIARLRAQGVEVFVMGERRVDLPDVMRSLHKHGIGRVLVEGGGDTECGPLAGRPGGRAVCVRGPPRSSAARMHPRWPTAQGWRESKRSACG